MHETDSPEGLKERLHAGLAARQEGNHKEAENICRQLLQSHPRHHDALNLLGVLLAETGRFDEAIEHLETAVNVRPQSANIRVNLAKTLLSANRPADAAHVLKTLTGPRVTDPQAHLLLVRALLADRRPDEAVKTARRALDGRPHDPLLLTALGDALVQADRPAEAIVPYHTAIRIAPNYSPAHNNLGTALEKLDRLDEAVVALERALEYAPDHVGARINLGTLRLRLGNAAAAAKIFETILKREPHNQRAIAYLAVARQEEGALTPDAARAALAPLIHEEHLPCPDGFSSLKEFHETLAGELYAHPARREDVSGTATTGGFDALQLFDHEAPALKALEGQLRAAIDRHIARLPPEPGHPFLGRRKRQYELDAWATFLRPGGYQFPHLHPSGWISGVYYVQIPPTVRADDAGHKGWIEFNRPDESFDYGFRPEVILKCPEPGLLLLFPSYAYHRTIAFDGDQERISIAFDAKSPA